MAHSPHEGVEATYEYAALWQSRCLFQDGSMLDPSAELWTPKLLDEFRVHFVENLLMGEGDFAAKFQKQLGGGSPDLSKLGAEMLWVLYLFPINLIKSETKRRQVRDVWSWSGGQLGEDTPALGALDHGLGNPGQGFNTYRWQELAFLWRLATDFKALDRERQEEICQSPWSFVEWLDAVPGSESRMLRHIMPHLLFPDSFERIAAKEHKNGIVQAFWQEGDRDQVPDPDATLSDSALTDLNLLRIRRRLVAEGEDEGFDFYQSPYREHWDRKTPPPPKIDTAEWWAKFFTSKEQAHAAFDLIREVLVAFGVEDSTGSTAQRVSFTYIKTKGAISMRVNCGHVQVLSIREIKAGPENLFLAAPIHSTDDPRLVGEPLASTYSGARIGFYTTSLEELLRDGSPDRALLLDATRHVADTYTNITKRNWQDAHRPQLLEATFHPEKRSRLFKEGLINGLVTPPLKPDSYTKADALRDLFMGEKQLDAIIEQLRRKKNIILQGAPGTGKTFVARRLAYLLMGVADEARAPITQFHQSTSYEDFIQGYRPDGMGGFELKEGIFYTFCRRALDRPGDPFVFIIDEINRGNLAKIFGELMMLIEPDKRCSDFAAPLNYAKSQDETFFVPPNVHLIGTMNTADRSLSLVDYALRRRFAFVEAEPGFASPVFRTVLESAGTPPALIRSIRERMEALNQMIESDSTNLGRGYRIGHSFFVPNGDMKPDGKWLDAIFRYEIVPLIEEYWADEPKSLAKAKAIIGDAGIENTELAE